MKSFVARYGPWALVAGASEGIGAAFADQLAARGLNVLLVARREGPLEALAERLRADRGVEVRCVAIDLARPDLTEAFAPIVEEIEVGLLVYNAALSVIGSFFDVPIERRMAEIDVNCRGSIALLYALVPKMMARQRGGVVLVTSMAGFQGSPLVAHYAATKAYGRVLAEGLWDELAGQGVDVLACVAGATRTPNYEATNPAPSATPLMEPERVAAEAIAALGGARPAVITGSVNRAASFLMNRVLPRSMAVRVIGKNVRKMYPR